MANISCEVIKDLLPLYVDGVLSDDAKKLVEKHIETCDECKKYYESLREDHLPRREKRHADDKAVIKRIKRRINVKRIKSVGLAVVLVAALAVGLFYAAFMKESYIPYEKAGLYLDGRILKTDINYYTSYGFDSPEPGTEFIYMTTTFYHSHRESNQTIEMLHLDNQEEINAGNDAETIGDYPIKEIYYVPEEYARQLSHSGFWSDHAEGTTPEESEENYRKANQELVEKLKSVSTLIWKAE